jgi:hypothetical protein
VTRFTTVDEISATDVDFLNTFDLVIVSRSVNSGHYQSDTERAAWNTAITAPVINMGGYTLRGTADGRLGFTDGTTMLDTAGPINLTVNNPSHPIFQGVALDGANTMVNPYAGIVSVEVFGEDGVTLVDTTQRGISVNNNALAGNGTLLATVGTAGDPAAGGMVIGEWQAGDVLNRGETLGGHRLIFLSGSREHGTPPTTSAELAGIYDLEADGATLFLNAVDYMAVPGAAGPLFDSITLNGDGTATLMWSGGESLQSTPTLSPANWTTVDGATSPFIVTADGASAFYRLVAP